MAPDTKTNIQTYVSPEGVASWLQRKKEGQSIHALSDPLCLRVAHHPAAGEDLPILLQQAPKSLAQGSATIIRGLLDPILEGKSVILLEAPGHQALKVNF